MTEKAANKKVRYILSNLYFAYWLFFEIFIKDTPCVRSLLTHPTCLVVFHSKLPCRYVNASFPMSGRDRKDRECKNAGSVSGKRSLWMHQTEALPDGFRASIWGIKKRLFAERIVEHSPKADNSLYGSRLHLPKKDPHEHLPVLL